MAKVGPGTRLPGSILIPDLDAILLLLYSPLAVAFDRLSVSFDMRRFVLGLSMPVT